MNPLNQALHGPHRESWTIATKESIPTYEDSKNKESKKCEDFPNYDYVMLCDSNRRYLDTKKLLPKSSTKIIACNTTGKAIDIMNNPRFIINKGLIINTGVNDIDHVSTEDVIHSQENLIKTATRLFPGKKLILSSITPTNDSLDHKAKVANQEIHEQIKDFPNVFHVNNGNLRDDRFYRDTKHLNKRFRIPALAKNIKKEIRNAFYPRQNFISKGNYSDVAQSYKPGNSSNGNPMDTAQPPNGQNYIYDHSTTKTDRVQDQLQNMASMLQNLIQSYGYVNQPQYQRVMYNPVPFYTSQRVR